MIDLYLFILLPIILGTLSYIAIKEKYIKIIVCFFQIIMLIGAIVNFLYIQNQGTIVQNLGGWPDYVGITLKADMLSSALVVLTILLFLAMLIFNYSKAYSNRLFVFLFITLEALIIGIFLSNDLFNLYVLLEVSTIIVSILIMFKKDSQSIYDGMIYLIVNIVAATFFLFGIGYIYKLTGVLDFTGIKSYISNIKDPKLLILPYAFIITGTSLKCALLPLFSWLPKAHSTPSAPSIISAILSGLYIKSGIYLFIRIQSVFSQTLDISEFFIWIGFLTGIIGCVLALSQTDLKLILAYSTISQIGLIMIGLNHHHVYAFWGAIYHIINHAIFKSALFLSAGIIIEEYQTRSLHKIRGVMYSMPVVGVITIISILGVTGAPFFNGSISKYYIQSGFKGSAIEYAILLINFGTILYFIKYCRILFGKTKALKAKIPVLRKVVIIFLGIICFIGGVYGERFMQIIFNQTMNIDLHSYLQKTFIYIVSLFIAYILHRIIRNHYSLFNRIKEINVSLNMICVSIVVFFVITLLYLHYKYIIII